MRFINDSKGRNVILPGAPTIIFLPGWGFTGRILGMKAIGSDIVFPDNFLDPDSLTDDLLDFIDSNDIDKVILLGWSLGGYLALDFAGKYPERIKSLYLLALRKSWPPEEIEAMQAGLIRDPVGTMKDFYRKCFLGQKKKYIEFVAKHEEEYQHGADVEILQRGLDYLEKARVDRLPGVKAHYFHGRRDVIAPIEERPILPEAETIIIDKAGHAVFLADEFFLPLVDRKRLIRQKFSAAAGTYDNFAVVQQQTAELLAGKLPPPADVGSVLELGCGTGNFTMKLVNRYPNKEVTAIDFSEMMLARARQRLAAYKKAVFKCEDAETFLAKFVGPFDLITSNATLQWFEDLPKAFAGISALLDGQGLFLASVFGPESLKELRQALREVLGYEAILPADGFPDKASLLRMTDYFANVTIEEVSFTRRYKDMMDLLINIRKTGTGGWHPPSPPVFTRNRLRLLDQWFAENSEGCRMTYQVFIVKGRKGLPAEGASAAP